MDCRHLLDRSRGCCYYCGSAPHGYEDRSHDPPLDHARGKIKELLHDDGFSLMQIAEATVRWEMARTAGERTFREDQQFDEIIKLFIKLRESE